MPTPEYQSINPNGLVPTLVHDGRTYIESVDIIQYLDDIAPEPPLTPADPQQRQEVELLLAAADHAQVPLKVLTHEFLFRGSGRYLGAEDQKKFATSHHNKWLVDFKRGFAARDAEWQAEVAVAVAEMSAHFRNLDTRTASNEWLVDGGFTLADVAWTPQAHRMRLMEWRKSPYPHLSRWYEQLQNRRSFQHAVVECEPAGLRSQFASYVAQRRREGTSVADALERSVS